MDTDSFVIHIKTEDFYKDIANDAERWFDTSNYDENKNGKRSLPLGKTKKKFFRFFQRLIRRKDYERIYWTWSKNMGILNE